MAIPAQLNNLAIPAIAAPMFLTSGPGLVVETCKGGIVGTFPALNQRTSAGFEEWIDEIEGRLGEGDAPYGVNLVVHRSNTRLEADLEVAVRRKVPLIITSLGTMSDVVREVQSYGGLVFHDVINRRHAEKAAEAGVDGIIGVCAGAGGHSGAQSPFALLEEIRGVFDGTVVLAGGMSTGAHIAAARVMGADMAYLGTRFIATREAMVAEDYKRMIVESGASDIIYTPNISGVFANFLRRAVEAAGLDPDALPAHADLADATSAKPWGDIWSAGQSSAGVLDVPSTAELCARLAVEYRTALTRAAGDAYRGEI